MANINPFSRGGGYVPPPMAMGSTGWVLPPALAAPASDTNARALARDLTQAGYPQGAVYKGVFAPYNKYIGQFWNPASSSYFNPIAPAAPAPPPTNTTQVVTSKVPTGDQASPYNQIKSSGAQFMPGYSPITKKLRNVFNTGTSVFSPAYGGRQLTPFQPL